MPFADPTRVANHIKDILNATTAGWGGAINDARRSDGAISQARIDSGMEILRAIAGNPQHGDFGSIATLIAVNHNQFLPAHDGEPGIPQIVPFAGADPREGIPADPDEIDSYRGDLTASPIYSGALDGQSVAHDAAAVGRISPTSCRYSMVNGYFKFTGLSAQVPLIQLTRAMADTGVPENYEPTIVKLSIPKLVKEGDNLAQYASQYAADGKQDLIEITGGAMRVRPLPNIVIGQKAVI